MYPAESAGLLSSVRCADAGGGIITSPAAPAQNKAQQTYIKDLSKHVREEITLKGWLYNMRSSGKLLFPQLRDGTGIVQGVVAKNAVTPELWEALKGLGQESSLVVSGRVREDARAPSGVEVDVTGAQVIQNAHDFPI